MPCSAWNPGFTVANTTGLESKAVHLGWTVAAPGPCVNLGGGSDPGWGGTDHVVVRRADGTSTPPSTPTSGIAAFSASPGAHQHDDYTQRSNKQFAYQIFACEDSSCTSWYGDGSGANESVTSGTGSTTTEHELWVLSDISGIMFTDDGVDQRVQLFVQSQDDTMSYHDNVSQICSVGDLADDFGLNCADTGCTSRMVFDGDTGDAYGAGYVAIPALGTSTTDYVDQAQHGRIAWDYIANPALDPAVDTPDMFFQMKRPGGGGTCEDTGAYDDVGQATGAWDTGTDQWDWTVVDDGGGCPDTVVTDGHDNSVVPLPNGEYKMYYKTYALDPTDEVWMVQYWDGGSWGDATEISVTYSDGTTDPGQSCVENFAAIARAIPGGGGREGAFMALLDGDTTFYCGGTGLDDDIGSFEGDAAIVFADLANG